MENYVFVCIGTKYLVPDSFGPRVGDFLKQAFIHSPQIQVFGTMQSPVHFQNANDFLKQIPKKKEKQLILIDSAFGAKQKIGTTYVSFGGMEIGKAFHKTFYFPAHLSIKTIVGEDPSYDLIREGLQYRKEVRQIEQLAQEVASKIVKTVSSF